MSVAPEELAAPADDAVVFRSSPWRAFVALFLVIVVAYVAVSPVVGMLLETHDPWWVTLLQAAAIGVLAAGAFSLSARSSLRTWVRISGAGLELAAQGSDPVLLSWPDIEHVTVRRAGARTILEVTPVDLDSVHPVDHEGPGWPALTETERGTAFTADLTQVWPGPRRLRRELSRRVHR
ncbi:MAG TPA: hypothetical protein VFH03_18880 [Actinoplanes sp.]|nr:hypothetical protein [Actinoplanes sp.]